MHRGLSWYWRATRERQFALCSVSHAPHMNEDNLCARTAKPFFCFVEMFKVSQNVVTVEFRSLPFFALIFLARMNEDSAHALHGMSPWWKKNWWTESWIEPWCWKSEGAREGVSREDEETFRRLTLTAPISACASSCLRLSSDWSSGSSGCPTYGREIHRSPCSQRGPSLFRLLLKRRPGC